MARRIKILELRVPADMTVQSFDGGPVSVYYSATTAGGQNPVTITYNPIPRSYFPVGTSTVTVTAKSRDGQSVSGSFKVTVSYTVVVPPPEPPPPTVGSYGPQDITLPAGVSIYPGQSIQNAVNNNPNGTTFLLRAGTHSITSSTIPKTGQTFVGEYGAILDGTNWSTTDEVAAVFQAYGGMGVTGVTIKNLVIRNMPKKGVYNADNCLDWTFDHLEVYNCHWGLVIAAGGTLTNSSLHNNGQGRNGGNYSFYVTRRYSTHPILVQNNEIAYGGDQQKSINGGPITWKDNWIHHNEFSGIWMDGEGDQTVIQNNICEDNGGQGIHIELAYGMTINGNTIRRNKDQGIYISTSRNIEVYGNIIENNYRGIILYLTGAALSQGWPWNPDLADINIHNNTINSGIQSGVIAVGLAFSGDTAAATKVPYLDGTKNLDFVDNAYRVPSLTGPWWLWDTTFKTWATWQALPQDATGTAAVL